MRLSYHEDTDSLYIHLTERPGVDVVEVSDGFIVDVDGDGKPVGVDIDANASEIVDLSKLEVEDLDTSLGLKSPGSRAS